MNSFKNKKILITCGPTCVAIDSMRVISNRSTGELGQQLAMKLLNAGAHITVLEGPVLKPLQKKRITVRKHFFYDELEKNLNTELKKKYDIVIHAAAVSDYKLAKPLKSKISSHLKQLTLTLIPTKKLINTIKQKSPQTFLIGFKLVDKLDFKILKEFFNKTKSDLVIMNSLTQNKYNAVIVDKNQQTLGQAKSRREFANKLIKILANI